MQELPKSSDDRLIVGTDGFSDAGVFEIAPELLIVQSLDFFAPLVDDPFVFGQIAAANSLSDVFAMGAKPVTAMNILGFPDDELDLQILTEILKGGTDKVHEAGASIVGGHSVRDKDIMYGLSITGIVAKNHLITNQGAQPGDLLVLTKKLGTGFITTAMKKNKCSQSAADEAISNMATLNSIASQVASRFGANAITDITGFGLAVHASEIAQASNVTLQIDIHKLPVLPTAMELARKGFVTRANRTNRSYCQSNLKIEASDVEDLIEIVFDPQTSGGLLISVSKADAENVVNELVESKQEACIVGTVHPQGDHALIIA